MIWETRNMKNVFDELFKNYPDLMCCRYSMEKAAAILKGCYAGGGKVLVCGNGGSAADSEHITGELMKGFMLKRKLKDRDREKIRKLFPDIWEYLSDNLQGALPAVSLVSQVAITSAFINDVAPDMVFAQQVYGYGKKGDVLIGLSTSGNSENVINAVRIAKAFDLRSIGMTGKDGGRMKDLCDVNIAVPETEVYRVQEYCLPIYHALCADVEEYFFGEKRS
jgi:D-sedoheptulose 7-phosphate isomerase